MVATAPVLKCTFCNKKFKHLSILKVHTQIHTGERPFKCPHCNYASTFELNLKRHLQVIKTQPEQCEHCEFIFFSRKSLRMHERESHSQSNESSVNTSPKPQPTAPPVAQIGSWKVRNSAPTILLSSTKVTEEIITKTVESISAELDGSKPLISCSFCSFVASDSSELAQHANFSRPGPPLQCHQCGFKSCTSSGIMKHRMEQHFSLAINSSTVPKERSSKIPESSESLSGNVDLKCKFCGKESGNKWSLALHLLTHTGERPLKCKRCSFACSDPSAMRKHEATRSGSTHRCLQCNLRFCHKQNIWRHKKDCLIKQDIVMKAPPPTPPLALPETRPCMYCKKEFPDKARLKVHLRIHTGEKPFKCDRCCYASSYTAALRYHMRNRSSTIYNCSKCDFTSCTQVYLRIHMKKAHARFVASIHKRIQPAGPPHLTEEDNVTGDDVKPSSQSRNLKVLLSSRDLLQKNQVVSTNLESRSLDIPQLMKASRSGSKVGEGTNKDTLKRIFRCERCRYKTKHSSHIILHRRIHTGEKPYKCSVCPYRSVREHDVKTHEMRHGRNVKNC